MPSNLKEHEQFVRRLAKEVASGGMSAAQRDDMLEQKSLFDQALDDNRVAHRCHVVGYIGGQKLVAESVPDLLREAKNHPGKMLYFEEL